MHVDPYCNSWTYDRQQRQFHVTLLAFLCTMYMSNLYGDGPRNSLIYGKATTLPFIDPNSSVYFNCRIHMILRPNVEMRISNV